MMKAQYHHTIQKRIDMDLLSRSSLAMAVYCIIFPAMLYPFGLFKSFPAISWGLSLGAIFFSLARLIHIRLSPRYYDRSPTLWMSIFKLFAIGHACLLSAMFVLASFVPGFKDAYIVTIIVIAGMASGGISSLSPNLFMALAFPTILLVPAISIHYLDEHTRPTALMMTVYYLYLAALAARTNKEYVRTFSIEEQLEKQKKELETLSRTDALTGIYNRGYFNTLYDMQWDSGVRNNIGLTIMMMDVDHFKHVNDTYGHTSGDECLKRVAETLRKCVKRKNDIICRFGGEEFAILISGTPIHETERLAERIRKSIAEIWVEQGEHRFQVTISIGISNMLPKIGDNQIILLEQADQALYRAKKSGRNCVRSFSP